MLSPSLTYASTATSDDSLLSPSAASQARLARAGAGSQLNPNAKPPPGDGGAADARAEPMRKDEAPAPLPGVSLDLPSTRSIQFDLSTTPEPRAPSPMPPAKHRKLRKARHDGYESDGGYVSDGTKSEKERKLWRRDKKEKQPKAPQGSDEESDGGYLSDILRKRRNKKKKDKLKGADYPPTDHETDGGYISSSSVARKKDKKSKRPSTPGDESDAGNLSESSTKKKRFFRLNTRSRKRNDSEAIVPEVIPPVPSLPPILPIAERFARSDTPVSTITASDYRTATPALSEQTTTQRSSDDASFTLPEMTSGLPPTPLDSPRGLTKAFADAQSVRTPSTDVLRAFGRQAGLSALRSPTKEAHTTTSASASTSATHASRRDSDGTQESSISIPSSHSHSLQMHAVPVLDLPQPKRTLSLKRTPPHVAAPNTPLSLSARPQPVPIVLAPPSPESIGHDHNTSVSVSTSASVSNNTSGSNSNSTSDRSSGSGSIGPMRMSPGTPNPETGSMLMTLQTSTPTSSLYSESSSRLDCFVPRSSFLHSRSRHPSLSLLNLSIYRPHLTSNHFNHLITFLIPQLGQTLTFSSSPFPQSSRFDAT